MEAGGAYQELVEQEFARAKLEFAFDQLFPRELQETAFFGAWIEAVAVGKEWAVYALGITVDHLAACLAEHGSGGWARFHEELVENFEWLRKENGRDMPEIVQQYFIPAGFGRRQVRGVERGITDERLDRELNLIREVLRQKPQAQVVTVSTCGPLCGGYMLLHESAGDRQGGIEAKAVWLPLTDKEIGELVGRLAEAGNVLSGGQVLGAIGERKISLRDIALGVRQVLRGKVKEERLAEYLKELEDLAGGVGLEAGGGEAEIGDGLVVDWLVGQKQLAVEADLGAWQLGLLAGGFWVEDSDLVGGGIEGVGGDGRRREGQAREGEVGGKGGRNKVGLRVGGGDIGEGGGVGWVGKLARVGVKGGVDRLNKANSGVELREEGEGLVGEESSRQSELRLRGVVGGFLGDLAGGAVGGKRRQKSTGSLVGEAGRDLVRKRQLFINSGSPKKGGGKERGEGRGGASGGLSGVGPALAEISRERGGIGESFLKVEVGLETSLGEAFGEAVSEGESRSLVVEPVVAGVLAAAKHRGVGVEEFVVGVRVVEGLAAGRLAARRGRAEDFLSLLGVENRRLATRVNRKIAEGAEGLGSRGIGGSDSRIELLGRHSLVKQVGRERLVVDKAEMREVDLLLPGEIGVLVPQRVLVIRLANRLADRAMGFLRGLTFGLMQIPTDIGGRAGWQNQAANGGGDDQKTHWRFVGLIALFFLIEQLNDLIMALEKWLFLKLAGEEERLMAVRQEPVVKLEGKQEDKIWRMSELKSEIENSRGFVGWQLGPTVIKADDYSELTEVFDEELGFGRRIFLPLRTPFGFCQSKQAREFLQKFQETESSSRRLSLI